MINLTDTAKKQIQSIIETESVQFVRVFVQGGGCSGFNYGFAFEDRLEKDDYQFDNIIVDAMSLQYLDGAIIDYKKDLMSSQFTISNPNATSTCGCGSSFSI